MTGGPGPARDAVGAARNALVGLLTALVKVALVDRPAAPAQWLADAATAQRHLAQNPDDVHALNLDGLWAIAVKAAERDPAVRRDETVNPIVPTMCPLPLVDLTARDFNFGRALHAFRDVASFG